MLNTNLQEQVLSSKKGSTPITSGIYFDCPLGILGEEIYRNVKYRRNLQDLLVSALEMWPALYKPERAYLYKLVMEYIGE